MRAALETALAASRPISDAPRQPLPVELLLSESQRRRISINDHARWQSNGKPPHDGDADLTELLTELQTVERNHRE